MALMLALVIALIAGGFSWAGYEGYLGADFILDFDGVDRIDLDGSP